MSFYDLDKTTRLNVVTQINQYVLNDITKSTDKKLLCYFSDDDTYIRKTAYLAIGKVYRENKALLSKIIKQLGLLYKSNDEKIRQTTINAAGEIGINNFDVVEHFFDTALFDEHHSVRNAVIGSVKKMGEKNPMPILRWAKKYLHHPDKEVRREICHGIELRGRKFPQDILPLLKELQFDETTRVSKTLIHVLGQIAYKKNCLAIVVNNLKTWENKKLVALALMEIIDVHDRYKNFSALTQQQAIDYIQIHFNEIDLRNHH